MTRDENAVKNWAKKFEIKLNIPIEETVIKLPLCVSFDFKQNKIMYNINFQKLKLFAFATHKNNYKVSSKFCRTFFYLFLTELNFFFLFVFFVSLSEQKCSGS